MPNVEHEHVGIVVGCEHAYEKTVATWFPRDRSHEELAVKATRSFAEDSAPTASSAVAS